MGIMEILFIVGLLTLSIMFPVVMGRIAIVGGLIILGLCIILVGGCFTVIGAGILGIGTIVIGVTCILAGLGINSAFDSHGQKSASKLGVVTMVSPDGRYQVLGVVMMVSPDGRYQVQVNNKIWDAVSSDKLAVEDKIEVISFTFNWGKELLTVRKKNNENSIICKACGTVVPNGYLYCPKCDKELNEKQAITENSPQPQEIKQETSENPARPQTSEVITKQENQEQPSGDNIGVVTSKVADKYRVWMNNNIWTAVSSDILAVGDKVELVSADNSAFMIIKRISSQPQGIRQGTSENSIICKTCGAVVPNGYQYCSKCGKELNK